MRLFRSKKLHACFVCLMLVFIVGAANLCAQEATKISGKMTATYTKMDSTVVGDVPGHTMILGTSEGTNTNTGENAFMDGAQITNLSFSDLVQGNGTNQGYVIFTKDGDVTYAKWQGKVTTTKTDEGEPDTSLEGTFDYTKGTGQFENIKGKGSYTGKFTSKTEYTVEWQGSYSIGK